MSNSRGTSVRRRLDIETRRRHLLEVGSELFAAHPYEDVWIDHVAERAGVSRGLLYHYFGGKRDFLVAVIEHRAAEFAGAIEPVPGRPPQEQLTAVLDAYFEYVEKWPNAYKALNRGAIVSDPRIREILDRNLRRQEQRILDAVLAGRQAEGTPPLLRLAVRGWLAFLISVCLEWLDDKQVGRDELRDLCVKALGGAIAGSGHPIPGRRPHGSRPGDPVDGPPTPGFPPTGGSSGR